MKPRLYILFSLIVVLSLLASACGQISDLVPGGLVTVTIVYGAEKQEWLIPLVQQYNNARNQTSEGKTIVVEATAMGSIESVRGIIDGTLQPTVWSPASSVYIPVANSEWKNTHADDLVVGTPRIWFSARSSSPCGGRWRRHWAGPTRHWAGLTLLNWQSRKRAGRRTGIPNGVRSSSGIPIPTTAIAASSRSLPKRTQDSASNAA